MPGWYDDGSEEQARLEKEHRARQQRAPAAPVRSPTAITYRGFCYDVRSQWGVDSLRDAIKANGDG
jgi:hypothetical protein